MDSLKYNWNFFEVEVVKDTFSRWFFWYMLLFNAANLLVDISLPLCLCVQGMKAVDSIMADIMVGTWLALSAVLMLNLLIALLSDTFQR